MEEILLFLCQIRPLSAECLAYLRANIKRLKVPKDQVILRIGEVNSKMYFIKTGLLHCFYYVKEKPVSDFFFFENEVVVSVGSFYKQVPSEGCMEALEESDLYYITKEVYDHCCETYMEFNYIARVFLEKYVQVFHEHAWLIRIHKARERYRIVLSRMPELIRRIPLGPLASWLGMDQAHLSRIRGKKK